MARTDVSPSSKSLVLIASVLAIAGLYFGRQILIPLALAVVFSFLLTPAVVLLEKIRFGRVPAVVTVLSLSFALVGAVSWGVAGQLVEITGDLPDYKSNLDDKIQALRASKDEHLRKATATVQELSKELAAGPFDSHINDGHINDSHIQDKRQPARPIPVQVAAPPSNLVQDLSALLGPLAGPVETAAIVIIFTLFMLVRREDLRNRAIRLAGSGQLNLMTQALDDASRRLSRYLLLQFLVNTGYGLLFGIALYFIGVPHALLWGVCAGLLRFVPYIGTFIGAAFPVAMALIVFPGWHQAGMAFGAFLVLELTISNIIEPLLYRAHTGISSLAILVAAGFWATLWGPVGLILSTPLTLCLTVLGRYVPQLKFLEILLGDEPVLRVEQRFYQRLLAMDVEEARTIAERYLKENSLTSLYEAVFVPALGLAEQDHRIDGLDDDTRRFLLRSTKELIEDLGDEFADLPAGPSGTSGLAQMTNRNAKIVCIPARYGADELVAMMLTQLLQHAGYSARVLKAGEVEDMVATVSQHEYNIAYVSSLAPGAATQTRALCRRLQARVPGLQVVAGVWNLEGGAPAARERLGAGCPDLVSTRLSDAVEQIRQLAASRGSSDPNRAGIGLVIDVPSAPASAPTERAV